MLQQVARPAEYEVLATLNLNGDYSRHAGGAGGRHRHRAGGEYQLRDRKRIFEGRTATQMAGQDKVNPSSVILSGEMMLRHMGWHEAADLITAAMEKTFAQKVVTYDFARLMEGATEVRCSAFGGALIGNM